MKKEQFIELGLEEEMAIKCEKASQEELKGFIPKARFDEVNNEKKKLESDVKERDTQLESLKNTIGDIDSLKKQITSLQEENKKKEESYTKELHQLKIDTAVKDALTSAKARNVTAVKALLKNLDKAELDENGTIKGLAEQLESLKQSDGYLFETKTKPSIKGAKPAETGNDDVSKIGVDVNKMTYTEMVEYLANNPDAKLY